MSRPLKVLIVEDSNDDAELLLRELRRGGFEPSYERVQTARDLGAALARQTWDVVLTDYSMPQFTGMMVLRLVKGHDPDLPVIIISGTIGEEIAVMALKAGANDYLIKGNLVRLGAAVARELREAAARAEHRSAADALRKSEERLRQQAALLDVAQDAILVMNLAHRIEYWNQSARNVYGWTQQEVPGIKAEDLMASDALDQFRQARRTTLDKGEWHGELRQRTKAGASILVHSRWTLVRDEVARPKSLLIVNNDITEQRAMEARLLQAQRLESLGTLAGGIAHDLNNVLTPLSMAVDLLRLPMADAERTELLTTLRTGVDRGTEMVKQILAFARGTKSERAPLLVRHLLEDARKMLEHTLPKSIQIVTEIVDDLWCILGETTQLYQVIMNLCINARDAMPDGGRITLRAENRMIDAHYAQVNPEAMPGPYVAVIVQDTGTGIPSSVHDRIFDPFFTTKEPGKGTGLGLSTVLGIVKSHNGFITVETEVGKGTTFSVCLPAQSVAEKTIRRAPPTDSPEGNGELILVADDERSIREISKVTLEAAGYRTLLVGDGAEAVSKYVERRREIQLVILDMFMPVMDGNATAHALRKVDPDIRLLATSGHLHPSNHGLERELVNDFLTKPFTGRELLAAVHRVLHPTGEYTM